MKANDKDQPELWRDTLDEGVPADFAQESLARMLGGARRRRQHRLAMKAGIITALIVPLLLMFHRTPDQASPIRSTSQPGASPEAIAETGPAIELLHPVALPQGPEPPKAAVVETIGDDELLSEFSGRPAMLVGTGDAKQLVLLDQKKTH
ncbi:hypothetical protein [Haloferula sp. BvORR071]|uniref:hypothetical protein n=1 Tax=Haloferula sp. BvORR071 TaxID=1396141 RepID=UPI00054E5F96|nr:hypothetical protein [Haloferula sp. BvORR071]